MNVIHSKIQALLGELNLPVELELSIPPNPQMGDIAIACFPLVKEWKGSPMDAAEKLSALISDAKNSLVAEVSTAGPYVNLKLNSDELVKLVISSIDENFGKGELGKGKKYLIEFACPNPLKAFHLGHLKNLITGESVVRVFENAGYEVVRVNYQGDVGMHVARALWGIFDWIDEFNNLSDKPVRERVEFLGKAYAHGAKRHLESEEGAQEVVEYNDKVYEDDPSIKEVYTTARQWSLDYFEEIYKRLGSHFDCYYFESETFERGVEIVKENLEKGIFKKSEGAIIFPGEEFGLHSRVFINSKGFPTYEAKDVALAERHFKEHNPDKIIHVVGKEQTEYFKVVFKTIEQIFPETTGKEFHLPGGFLQLKGEQKMSSRTGNIITGDALIEDVKKAVSEVMNDSELENKEEVLDKVSIAALKYAMLKADVKKDVAFDMDESVSTSGDSGPYLLYTVSRINSILEKVGETGARGEVKELHQTEKNLLVSLANFPEVAEQAVLELDPSKVSKYIFTLAQQFSSFYGECSVINEEDENTKKFRVELITKVREVMVRGLYLIGIETVNKM